MRHKLFTVDDIFNIAGRGIVVTGELEPGSPVFKIGSVISLIRPDGKIFKTEVGGIEAVGRRDYENVNRNQVGVMFKSVTKQDVPIGTVVFLED